MYKKFPILQEERDDKKQAQQEVLMNKQIDTEQNSFKNVTRANISNVDIHKRICLNC